MLHNLKRDPDCQAKIAAIDECIKKLVKAFVLIIAIYEMISSTQYVTISHSL